MGAGGSDGGQGTVRGHGAGDSQGGGAGAGGAGVQGECPAGEVKLLSGRNTFQEE